MNLINILMKRASKFSLSFIERRFKSDGSHEPTVYYTVTLASGITPVTDIPDKVSAGSNFSATIIVPHNAQVTATCGTASMVVTIQTSSPTGDRYGVAMNGVDGDISITYTTK